MIVLVDIEGIGDATDGQWRFCSAVPSYGGDECKPWICDWPNIRGESVDELGGVMETGELSIAVTDGSTLHPSAVTRLVRLFARPVAYLSEDVSQGDTAFVISQQAVDPPGDGDLLWMGQETMLRGANSGGDITVTRARLGTTALKHKAGSPIYAAPQYLHGRVMRLWLSPPSATSEADEELIGEYVIDSFEPSEDMSSWTIAGRSRLVTLARRIASRPVPGRIAKSIDPQGLIQTKPTAQTVAGRSYLFADALVWGDGYLRVGKELVVCSGSDFFAALSVGRGALSSEIEEDLAGKPIEVVLVSDAFGPGTFRYSSSNSTSRSTGWTKTEHWVDILLCLITSSAHEDDGLELANGNATHGSWCSLPVGYGLGIPIGLVDLPSFLDAKARTLAWTIPGLVVDAQAGSFAKWATTNILSVVGAFLAVHDGKIHCVLTRRPSPLDTAAASSMDESVMTARPKARLAYDDLCSEVSYAMTGPNGQEVTETYRAEDLISIHTQSGRYDADLNSVKIDVPSMVAGESDAPGWLRSAGQRRLLRGAQPRWSLKTESDIQLRTEGPGAVVLVSANSLPDLASGTLGWSDVPAQILSRAIRIDEDGATVSHDLKAYDLRPVRNIGPSALVESVAGDTATVRTNLFSQADALGLLPDSDAGSFSVGQVLSAVAASGVAISGTQTIVSISGDDIELDGDFGGSLAAGHILCLAEYADAQATDLDTYGYIGLLSAGSIEGTGELHETGEI